ncbi:MAG: chitinase [Solirubrobacteraceae bacterium]
MGVGTSYRSIAACAACLLLLLLGLMAAQARAQPVELAAPYEYLGWGNPQAPASVLAATGVKDLTLAFMLSHGTCDPRWDGKRPLLGGSDQAAIESIRAAGGDVDVSFGGWSGRKLGSACKTPQSLAAAYQKVIDAYSLRAIDIDIEHGEFTNKKTRLRVVAALASVQQANPGLEISITFGTAENGPEADGQSLIADAAAIGFQPSVWTIMPFDFGAPVANMGQTSIAAAEGLARELSTRYGLSAAAAYEHVGISSMNGRTDESDETVSAADFQAMLNFAGEHHLGRLTFWSVNRDRPCAAGNKDEDSCSGIAQQPFQFSDLVAQFHG